MLFIFLVHIKLIREEISIATIASPLGSHMSLKLMGVHRNNEISKLPTCNTLKDWLTIKQTGNLLITPFLLLSFFGLIQS